VPEGLLSSSATVVINVFDVHLLFWYELSYETGALSGRFTHTFTKVQIFFLQDQQITNKHTNCNNCQI